MTSQTITVLVRDDGARGQSGELRNMNMYPHVCECGAAAYIGGDQIIRCTNEDCRHMDKDLDIGKLELDWDEDTLPQFDLRGVIKWPT